MSDEREKAYRHLLYVAMLQIRYRCQSRGRFSRNPLRWLRQYRNSRVAGAVADWLHNLAQFAARHPLSMDEERFWKEHGGLCRRFPGEGLEQYREVFDKFLVGEVQICIW
jgi:hypothetical protein